MNPIEELSSALGKKLSLEDEKAIPSELLPSDSPPKTNLDVWKIIDKFMAERGLVYHKIEPYNQFLDNVRTIISSSPPIVVEDRKTQNIFKYTFGNVCILPPSLTPQDARIRGMDYNASVVVDIIQTNINALEVTTHTPYFAQKICELPLMLRSKFCLLSNLSSKGMIAKGECEHDIGGYYIVNGKERCIVAQERIEYNRIYVWPPQKPTEKKTYKYMAEIRSVVVRGTKPSILKIFIEPSRNTLCILPNFKEEIQIGTVLHALGYVHGLWDLNEDSSGKIRELLLGSESERSELEDEEMSDYIDHILRQSTRNEDCIRIISDLSLNGPSEAKERETFVRQLLVHEIFVHIPPSHKVYFFAYMIRKLVSVLFGRKPEDDRDHFSNKRCDTDGQLLEDLFRGLFEKYLENVTMKLISHPTNVSVFEREMSITYGIHHCMSTGNWGIQKIGFQKVGVSQLLTRTTYASALSHIRRVSSNRSKESRAMKLRQLHSSQWGIFDPAETPEGEMSGILKNLSLGGHITTSTSESPVLSILSRIEEFDDNISIETMKFPKVFLNGKLLGITTHPGVLVAKLRDYRKEGYLHHDTSICYKLLDREIHVYCDSGRCSRPLFKVTNGKLFDGEEANVNAESWHSLLEKGYIQYVDTNEEEYSLVATYPSKITSSHEYCEIHPALILGVSCSIIPFPGNEQSPRVAYSASMTKQAIGIFVSNFLQRFETSAYILHSIQRPLVVPRASNYFAYSQLPSGMNAIVAIMCYSGLMISP